MGTPKKIKSLEEVKDFIKIQTEEQLGWLLEAVCSTLWGDIPPPKILTGDLKALPKELNDSCPATQKIIELRLGGSKDWFLDFIGWLKDEFQDQLQQYGDNDIKEPLYEQGQLYVLSKLAEGMGMKEEAEKAIACVFGWIE